MKLVFHTNLNSEECIRRLEESAGLCRESGERLWFRFGGQPWRGLRVWVTVSRNRFSLLVMGAVRNSLRPIFNGRVISQTNGAGAMIEGHFAIHWLVRVFAAVWMMAFVASAAEQVINYRSFGGAAGMLAIALVPWAMAGISRIFTKGQEREMIAFLEKKLHARPVEAAPTGAVSEF